MSETKIFVKQNQSIEQPFSKPAQVIQHWADIKPEAPALKAPGADDISYGRLKKQFESVTEQLSSLGYGADHRLALVLPHSILLASALLTLSNNCTIMPVNNALTASEQIAIMKKADISAVVTTPGFGDNGRAAASQAGLPVLELITEGGKPSGLFNIKGAPALIPSSTSMQPDMTAFIMPTSGTTGVSKLVPFSSHMLVDVAAIKSAKMGMRETDTTIVFASLILISGLGTVMLPLLYRGGCAVIAPFNILNFFDLLETYQPNWENTSPALLHAIYEYLRTHPVPPAIKRLRYMRTGGAPFPGEMMRTLESWLDLPIIPSFGMTEGLAGNLCNPMPPGIRKHDTVGLPVHGEIAIFSDDGAKLSIGEVGELALRSPYLFKGYLNPEDNTPSPFRDGWFMTGDLARVDEDGYVTIVGRRKEMINSGAMKILPREVEEAICLHPEAAEACVVPLPHPTLGEQVAAAVVRRSSTLTEKELVDHLKTRLAIFKIPSSFYFIEKIPRSPAGKMARREVIAMIKAEIERSDAADQAVSLSPTGQAVLAVWQKVLGGQVVNPNIGFLPSGGDSLAAVRLADLLSETFSVDFAVIDVFDFSTVLSQAAEIDRRRAD